MHTVRAVLRRSALFLMLASVAGCAGGVGQTFMVSFMSFSATPDAQGQAVVQAAIAFANAHPLAPITIDGFRTGQYPNESDTIAAERVEVVSAALVEGGVSRARIEILGHGIAYPQGSPMPSLPSDRVKIAIAL